MAGDGPTTVGSIVGKLKLDDSDWNRELDAAEAKARGLDSVNPTVRVNANVDQAIRKLAAVDAAQEKLGASTERLKIAYQRLDEIQSGGKAKQSTLMAAHLAATQAENAHARATRDLAEAELAAAAATEVETVATNRSTAASGRRLAHWQVIALAIGSLIPLLGALSGYAVGVAGGLAGMGAAGILAVVGIKNAMEQGNAVGSQYRDGLSTLKGIFGTLSETSATAMLVHFQQAVVQLNAAMPMLNGQVGVFSNLLGASGNKLLDGILTALRVMNPLLVTGALYVDRLAEGFANWTGDGGLQSFSEYAIRQLPVVAAALGQILTMALHLVQATAPMGTVALEALTGIAAGINALPIDVLSTLLGAAIAVPLAFKAWAGISAIVAGVSGALGTATFAAAGLPGIIIAASVALSALAIGLSRAANSKFFDLLGQSHTVDEYSAAIRRGNIDIGNLGALLSSTSGFWNDFSKNIDVAGVGASRFYDEAKKVDEALASASPEDLVAGYKDLISEGAKVGKTQEELANLFPLSTAAYQAQVGVLNTYGNAASVAASKQDALATTMGVSTGQYQAATAANQATADQLAITTLEMQLQNDAAGLLNQALGLLGGGALGLASAQTSLDASMNRILDSFALNGAAVNGNTEAAVANQQAIQGNVQSALDLAEAVAQQTGSSEAAKQSYVDSKAALEAQMSAQGLLTAEVQAYIDQLYAVDSLVIKPTKLDVDNAEAVRKLAEVRSWMDSLQKVLTIRINTITSNTTGSTGLGDGHADGGTVGGFGTSRSDSNVVRLSRGEEVVRESSASAPGVRPLLKAINANPAAAMSALATGSSAGPQFVEAGAGLLRALRDLAARPVIVQMADGALALASQRGNEGLNSLGAN